MRTLFYAICILISGVCGVLCQSYTCVPNEVERCTQNLKSLYSTQDGPVILKSEYELTELCRHQQSALNCINNFVEHCMPEPHRNIFNNLTSGTQDFLTDFCSEDSYTRKVYLKHLDCFNKQVDKVHHCTQRLHEWNKNIERSRAPKEEIMRQACCRYDLAMSCMRTVVRNECPSEAADLFDGLVNKATKQFIQIANCAQHNYVLAECSGALPTISPSVYSSGALPTISPTVYSSGALSTISPSVYSTYFSTAIVLLFTLLRKFW